MEKEEAFLSYCLPYLTSLIYGISLKSKFARKNETKYTRKFYHHDLQPPD